MDHRPAVEVALIFEGPGSTAEAGEAPSRQIPRHRSTSPFSTTSTTKSLSTQYRTKAICIVDGGFSSEV